MAFYTETLYKTHHKQKDESLARLWQALAGFDRPEKRHFYFVLLLHITT
jgi:hypothetical protein